MQYQLPPGSTRASGSVQAVRNRGTESMPRRLSAGDKEKHAVDKGCTVLSGKYLEYEEKAPVIFGKTTGTFFIFNI